MPTEFNTNTDSKNRVYIVNDIALVPPATASGFGISNNITSTYNVFYKTSGVINATDDTGSIRFSGTVAHTIFQTLFNEISISGGNKGGSVLVQSGVYLSNNNIQISVSGTGSYVRVMGTDRDNVIVRATGNAGFNMFSLYCDTKFENITLDGNNVAAVGVSTGQPVKLELEHCRVKKNTSFQVWAGSPGTESVYLYDNIFEEPQTWEDLVAATSVTSGEVIVTNNVFDRTGGITSGTCLSTGRGNNMAVSNNIFRKSNITVSGTAIFGYAFLVEPGISGDNMSNIVFSNNVCIQGGIRIGRTSASTSGDISNVIISNNTVKGAEIGVIAPVDYSGKVTNVTITNNQILDSDTVALRLLRLGPQTNMIVNSNIIKDSNLSFQPHTFSDDGLMQVNTVGNARISDNLLVIGNTTSGASPYGIRCESGTNIAFSNNHIINTAGNNNISFTNLSNATVTDLNITASGLNCFSVITTSSAPVAASGGAVPTHARGWMNVLVSGTSGVRIPFY